MNKNTKQFITDKIWRAIGASEEFLALKYRPGYTPWQIMEIRGSFLYFTFILSVTLIAAIFQAIAGIKHVAIVVPLILNLLTSFLAFINYRLKRAQKYYVKSDWIIAIMFCMNIIMSRYIYAFFISWDFALSSYNISMLFISVMISSIMLYNRRIFRTVFLLILVNWIIFLMIAVFAGTEMHLSTAGNSLDSRDFNILRELFIIIVYVFLSAAVYMNISVIESYERRSDQQQQIISDYNRFLSQEVDEKTRELQNELRERKSTEEFLHILSEAVKFSPVGISVTDTEGSILYANPWFESVTGYSLDEIRGRRPGPLLNKNLTREERRAIYATVRAGGEWRGELMNIKKNGEEFWDRVAISSIRDSENRITHYVAIQEDITHRKRIEDELAESENKLRERNRAIEKDISIAEIVQKTLLKHEKDSNSIYRVDVRQKSVEKIGGDFFAIRTPSSGELCIFIGDVSGHGVASALFTSLLKFITDELMARYHNDPAAYLEKLNSGISGYMSNYFLTGIYSCISYNSNQGLYDLYFANGGHPSPVIVRAGGEVIVTESRGPLIGYNMDANYRSNHITLSTGDRVFLFTDGVIETTNQITGHIVGFDDDLAELFRNPQHCPDEDMLDKILAKLDTIRGTDIIEDDLLLIGIKIP